MFFYQFRICLFLHLKNLKAKIFMVVKARKMLQKVATCKFTRFMTLLGLTFHT